jgi:subfamily B ATP-binding cassette protein MsbA
MILLKPSFLSATYFPAFGFYYKFISHRFWIIILFSLAVGVIDGVGLSVFLPLLQVIGENKPVDIEGLGKLKFLFEWIQNLGITLNLTNLLLLMFAFFVFKAIITYLSQIYIVFVQQFFARKLRIRLIDGLGKLSYSAFTTFNAGKIQNTFTSETSKTQTGLGNYLTVIQQLLLVGIYFTLSFYVDFIFASIVVGCNLLLNVFLVFVYKKNRQLSGKLTTINHKYHGAILQLIQHYKYLRATALIHIFNQQPKKAVRNVERVNRRMGILNGFVQAIREPVMVGILALALMVKIHFFNAELSMVIISVLFFQRALSKIINLQQNWNRFLRISGSVKNMMETERFFRNNSEDNSGTLFNGFNTNIEFKNAAFSYDTNPVFKDLNLDIKKNESVGLVGASGSGKTTFLNILNGLVSLDQGEFLVDGLNISEIDKRSFQSRIGYVTQEPAIFNDTIFNNITFWDTSNESSRERFKEVVEKAALTQFIDELPEREQTLVGHNGINISGGQKQRIAIARELYRDVDILIMDEATSALDSTNEQLIQKNIELLKGRYTLIIAAHRLSTIKNLDRIIVLEGGNIVAMGNYEELMESSTEFQEMIEKQRL